MPLVAINQQISPRAFSQGERAWHQAALNPRWQAKRLTPSLYIRNSRDKFALPNRDWTYGSLLVWTRQMLKDRGLYDTRLKAEFLLAHVLGANRLDLFLEADLSITPKVLSPGRRSQLETGLHQLLSGVPVEYVTGRQAFYGSTFRTRRGAFISRPETEKLVDVGLKVLKQLDPQIQGTLFVAEPFAGGACVSLSLARSYGRGNLAAGRGDIEFHCTEKFETPAQLARDNIRDKDGRVKIYRDDSLQHRGVAHPEMYHLIVANPPYVPSEAAKKLKIKEPLQAIDGGTDGLREITRLLQYAPASLHPNGYLIMEIHVELEEAVKKICAGMDAWKSYAVLKTSGGSRILVATRFEGATFDHLGRSEEPLPQAMIDGRNHSTLQNKIMSLLIEELRVRIEEINEILEKIGPQGSLRTEHPQEQARFDADFNKGIALTESARDQIGLADQRLLTPTSPAPNYFEVLRIHIQTMKRLAQTYLPRKRFFNAWHLHEKDTQAVTIDNYTVIMILLETMAKRMKVLRDLESRFRNKWEQHLPSCARTELEQAQYLMDTVICFCRGEVIPKINERLSYGLRSNWHMVKGGLVLQCERLDESIAVLRAIHAVLESRA